MAAICSMGPPISPARFQTQVFRSAIAFILAVFCWSPIALAEGYHFATLDVPGSTSTAARGINNVGQVVGSFTRAGSTIGFLYSDGIFSHIDVPGAAITMPSGIDSAGRVVGFYLAGGFNSHGFLYAGGVFSPLDVPGASATRALGISDAGQVVGTFTDTSGDHGFLYDGTAFTAIDVPAAVSTAATGINNAGEIVGTYTDTGSRVHGFLYAGGVFSRLDAPGEGQPPGLGINDASQIVGFPGFLYTNGTFAAIDVTGAAQRTEHGGIDNAGAIAGSYLDARGIEHGFIATLPAESVPATASTSAGRSNENPAITATTLTPRSTASPGPCNVTGDTVVSVSDVQRMVNEALGISGPVNDLNADRVVNVADVQIVINAVLQLGCAAGSSGGTGAVAHLSVQSGNGQVACICITSTLQKFQPIFVKATDSSGAPVAGATVTWSVTSGQMTLAGPTSVTDSNGVATQGISLLVLNNFSSSAVPYLVSTVQAASNNTSVVFNETQSLVTSQGSSVIQTNPPQFGGMQLGGITLSAGAGTTLSTPIQTNIGGVGIASNGVPNVSVRILNQQSSPTVTCVTGGNNADPSSVLSDAQGNTACYPIFTGSGSGKFYLLVGGVPGTDIGTALYLQLVGPFSFNSLAGAPAAVQIVSGNNQVAPIGQTLSPLVARLVDGQGNIVPGQTMVWTVVPAGAASLTSASTVTDANGEVTATGSLGLLASAGTSITVALASNTAIAATFQETIPGALTALTKVSGDNQTAVKGANFANPLVVQLVNASGPVANFPVHFTVTGPVNLGGGLAGTDANGQASITIMAGSSSGTATVTATAAALTQTFTLTVTAQ